MPLLKLTVEPFPVLELEIAPAHQQRRYMPPAKLNAPLPQLTIVPEAMPAATDTLDVMLSPNAWLVPCAAA
jgi:hypothetical protein